MLETLLLNNLGCRCHHRRPARRYNRNPGNRSRRRPDGWNWQGIEHTWNVWIMPETQIQYEAVRAPGETVRYWHPLHTEVTTWILIAYNIRWNIMFVITPWRIMMVVKLAEMRIARLLIALSAMLFWGKSKQGTDGFQKQGTSVTVRTMLFLKWSLAVKNKAPFGSSSWSWPSVSPSSSSLLRCETQWHSYMTLCIIQRRCLLPVPSYSQVVFQREEHWEEALTIGEHSDDPAGTLVTWPGDSPVDGLLFDFLGTSDSKGRRY